MKSSRPTTTSRPAVSPTVSYPLARSTCRRYTLRADAGFLAVAPSDWRALASGIYFVPDPCRAVTFVDPDQAALRARRLYAAGWPQNTLRLVEITKPFGALTHS